MPAVLRAERWGADRPGDRDAGDTRWARWLFAVALVAAVPVLFYAGRRHWFLWDEWWLLVHEGSLFAGALDGHNGHWFTVTTVFYRLTFWVWGLDAYWPYQVPVIFLHLGAVVLVRAVMRRLGVRGWIATVAAGALVLFGSGQESLFLAIQMSWNASLCCGLGMLLLADRDGPVDGRDGVGLALGLVGLTTSSVFVPLLAGVGLAVLLRRGRGPAAFYVVPLAVVFVLWYVRFGAGSGEPPTLSGETFRFLGKMVGSTFWALAQSGWGAVLLALPVVAVLAVTTRDLLWARIRGSNTLVPALAASWAGIAVLTALTRAGRGFVGEEYDADRYLYVGAVLLLPLVALGAEHLARRVTVAGVLPLLLLAAGVPGNLDRLMGPSPDFPAGSPFGDVGEDGRDVFLALAESDFLERVPGDVRPLAHGPWYETLPLTTDWLREQAAAGRIPSPDRDDPEIRLTADRVLVLAQEQGRVSEDSCQVVEGRLRVVLDEGEEVGFEGPVSVSLVDGPHESYPTNVDSADGNLLRARAGPVELMLGGAVGQAFVACLPD